jgi:broad specificity phosphatase PhoE
VSTWIFLRHGESTANAARVFSGHQDVALTPLGRTQARAAGRDLRSALAQTGSLRVLSSDLQRAHHTTQLALAAAEVDAQIQLSPLLRERHLGDWQAQSIEQLKVQGARDVLLSWDGRAPGGGESLHDLARRIVPYLASQDTADTVLVGCHGGVVRTVVGLADGMDLPSLCRWNVPNCEPQIREYPSGIWEEMLRRL